MSAGVMGGRVEGLVCADPYTRTPICTSGIEHLSRKYEQNVCDGMIRSIKYSDRDLDSIVDDNNNTANVLQYREIDLNENAKKALSMSPGFMMYEKIDDLNIEVEIEKGCTKSKQNSAEPRQ